MSVPNTETFSLTDITSEIGGGLTSLQACFDNASCGGFDSNCNNDSYAPPNSMLRFRNYSHGKIIEVNYDIISRTAGVLEFDVCFHVEQSSSAQMKINYEIINKDNNEITIDTDTTIFENSTGTCHRYRSIPPSPLAYTIIINSFSVDNLEYSFDKITMEIPIPSL